MNAAAGWLALGAMLGLLLAIALRALAVWSDHYLNSRRAEMGALPDPDTLEARNARSLARYHARRIERLHANSRFTT